MIVIKPENQYDAARVMKNHNSRLITSRVVIDGEEYLVIESGPSAALLEIYINYGIKEIKNKPINN